MKLYLCHMVLFASSAILLMAIKKQSGDAHVEPTVDH